MRNDQSSPEFINCTFSENSTAVDGGGMFNIESTTILTDCNFVANSAGEEGGGMWNEMSSLALSDCNFIENSADPCGGAVWNRDCDLMLSNCTFIGNSALEGAGLYNLRSNAEIRHCVIAQSSSTALFCRNGNTTIINCRIAANGGAALDSWSERRDCTATISNCEIVGNAGGGILCDQTNASITNCLIAGNGADGIYSYGNRSMLVTNCTIVNNKDQGLDLGESRTMVNNCIIRNNLLEEILEQDGLIRVSCGNVQGGWPGIGNMDADPCFAQPGSWVDVNDYNVPVDADDPNAFWLEGDYRLLAGSPCVDTGDTTAVPSDAHDLDADGNTTELMPWDLGCNRRIVDGNDDGTVVVDMGAYEFFVPPVEVSMKLTPQSFNPGSQGNWVKAHCVLPEEFGVEDVDSNTPAILEPFDILSDYMNVFVNDDGLVEIEIAFDREAFCGVPANEQFIEVTVTGSLTSGQDFAGSDTIKVTNNNLKCLAVLASNWLQAGCGEPDWCDGLDLDGDSVVNFADFVLSDDCCIEIVTE